MWRDELLMHLLTQKWECYKLISPNKSRIRDHIMSSGSDISMCNCQYVFNLVYLFDSKI